MYSIMALLLLSTSVLFGVFIEDKLTIHNWKEFSHSDNLAYVIHRFQNGCVAGIFKKCNNETKDYDIGVLSMARPFAVRLQYLIQENKSFDRERRLDYYLEQTLVCIDQNFAEQVMRLPRGSKQYIKAMAIFARYKGQYCHVTGVRLPDEANFIPQIRFIKEFGKIDNYLKDDSQFKLTLPKGENIDEAPFITWSGKKY